MLTIEPAHRRVEDVEDEPKNEASGQEDDADGQVSDRPCLLIDRGIMAGLRFRLPDLVILLPALDQFLEVGDVFLLGIAFQHDRGGLGIVVDCGGDLLQHFKGRLCLPFEDPHDGGLGDFASIGDILVAKIHGFALGIEVEEELALVYIGEFHKNHPLFLIVVHNTSEMKRRCFKIDALFSKLVIYITDICPYVVDTREVTAMNIKNPIVIRLASLMDELDEGPLRAVYMVVNEMHELQTGKKKPADTGEILKRR